jgi:excisionase family DNA binding protein
VPKTKPQRAQRRGRAPLAFTALGDDRLESLRESPDAPVPVRIVAQLCGVDLKTVHQWASSGLIAHFRTPGRHLRFRAQEVLRFLERSGHPRARKSPPAPVLVLVSPALRAQASSARGAKVLWCTEPYEALVTAARSEVARIVVDSERLRSVELRPYLAALRLAGGPDTRVYLIAAGNKPKVAGVHHIASLEDALSAG